MAAGIDLTLIDLLPAFSTLVTNHCSVREYYMWGLGCLGEVQPTGGELVAQFDQCVGAQVEHTLNIGPAIGDPPG
jgi:hypothetical protein